MTVTVRRSLTEESWDRLFDFLDPTRRAKEGPNRDKDAEAKFQVIVRKLVTFFASRECGEAEDLAMETILRVATKCHELAAVNPADRMGYFFGVARNVLHEWQRDAQRELKSRESMGKDPTSLATSNPEEWASDETADRCLEQCLTQLTGRARRLIISYYEVEKAARIARHQRLADEFGKSVNALRIEVHRIRKLLRECVVACLSPSWGAEPAFSFVLKAQRERGAR